MLYEICGKTGFHAGAALTVKIPESDLDIKALYTILAEKPDFALPFSYRAVDGEIEFIYQTDQKSRLADLTSENPPHEHAELWGDLFDPIVNCGDWFMDPYSFVLDYEYIYCGKNKKPVSFIYIPSARACSDYSALKSMAAKTAENHRVTDAGFECEIERAIQNFCLAEFLDMIKRYKYNAAPPQNVKTPAPDDITIDIPSKENGGKKPRFRFFGLGKKPKKETAAQSAEPTAELPEPFDTTDGATVVDAAETGAPRLRYAGAGGHPPLIKINAGENEIFIIGRQDAASGNNRPGIDFDKNTKAVSRRHAAVERGEGGYTIADLGSSAGTFVNGERLPVNTPSPLTDGCRVSFGNSGADYIWEA